MPYFEWALIKNPKNLSPNMKFALNCYGNICKLERLGMRLTKYLAIWNRKETISPQTIEKKQLKEHSPKIFSTLSNSTSRGEGSLLTGDANFRYEGRLLEGVLKLKKHLRDPFVLGGGVIRGLAAFKVMLNSALSAAILLISTGVSSNPTISRVNRREIKMSYHIRKFFRFWCLTLHGAGGIMTPSQIFEKS